MSDREIQGSSIDWFGKSPNNVEIAIHVAIQDVPEIKVKANDEEIVLGPLDAMVTYLTRMDKKLADAGYTRSERLDKPARGGGGKGPPVPAKPVELADGQIVKCGLCGSEKLYDNRDRKEKEGWRGPAFKCRDCKAVSWDMDANEWREDRAA